MESLFVLWRVTGKIHFREWSWHIFRAFHRHSKVEGGGYANLDSCLEVHRSSKFTTCCADLLSVEVKFGHSRA